MAAKKRKSPAEREAASKASIFAPKPLKGTGPKTPPDRELKVVNGKFAPPRTFAEAQGWNNGHPALPRSYHEAANWPSPAVFTTQQRKMQSGSPISGEQFGGK